MNKKIILIIGAFIIIGFNPTLKAQEDEEIKTEEITVESSFVPTLPEVFKINLMPEIPELEIDKPEFAYELAPVKILPTVNLKTIVPAKIKSEAVDKLKRNFVRVGMGNYTTPYFEIFANSLRSKNYSFGAHIKHLSSSGKIKDYANSDFSTNQVNLYGKKFTRTHTINLKTFYDRKVVHFYGFQPADFASYDFEDIKDDMAQKFIATGAQVKFYSNYLSKRKLNHKFDINYYYLYDNYDTEEHNINFTGQIDKNVEFLKFSDNQTLGLDANVDYYFFDRGTQNLNDGLIKLLPSYTLQFLQYKFTAGLNSVIVLDDVTEMFFFPKLLIEVEVIKEHLKTYAGINGDIEKNSYRKLSDKNPFISTNIPLSFTRNKLSQFGGIKGNINEVFDFDVSFTNSTLENTPFFITDTISIPYFGLNNQFTIVHDTTKYSRVMADLGYHHKDKFKIILHAQYNNYFNKNEDYAWHIPKFEGSLSFDYNIQNKITIRSEVFGFTDMYAKVPVYSDDGSNLFDHYDTKTINGAIDLNIGINYQYSKLLGAFLNFNNILGKEYLLWYQYPTQKFSILGGINYSF